MDKGGGTCISSSLGSQPVPISPVAVFFSGVVQLFTLQHLTAHFFFLPAIALGNGRQPAKFLVLSGVMATCPLAVY